MPQRTPSPGDMWKCHINSSEHYGDIPLRWPWRQKMLNSPEESDLEDSLAHTSWTLLLIYITLLTKKKNRLFEVKSVSLMAMCFCLLEDTFRNTKFTFDSNCGDIFISGWYVHISI